MNLFCNGKCINALHIGDSMDIQNIEWR